MKLWIQEVVKRMKEKGTIGALRKRLKIPEGKKIPLDLINELISKLREKAKGKGKLSKSELRFLRQLVLARTLRKLGRK